MKAEPKRLVLTPGEPAGIGPDITIIAAQHAFDAEIVVVGSPALLEARAKLLGLPIALTEFNPLAQVEAHRPGHLRIIPVDLKAPCIPGTLNVENSAYVLETLRKAVTECLEHTTQALITGPVHKGIIAQSGVAFTGHTEFLASCCQVNKVLMTFHTPDVFIGLATIHVPLKDVARKLSFDSLTTALTLFHHGLKNRFHIAEPKILVCGLNPHAGENGLLGCEEQEMILPVISHLKSQGMMIAGPHSGDTAFSPENRQAYNGIFAMYHDQGLAPIKALYFNNVVNVTMGLPFLRTSVDHGTALELAGKNPCAQSLLRAIQLAQLYGDERCSTRRENVLASIF